MTRKSGDSVDAPGPVVTGRMVRLTVVKWPFVFTRRPGLAEVSLVAAALCSVVVSSRRKPSRAILRMLLMPASPGLGSRNRPVRPCR